MIYTFYSFKGGVGRSMAMANVAEILYRKGLKVLLIDFDLEAPGLERYFNSSEANYSSAEILGKKGLIDLLIFSKELQNTPRISSPFQMPNGSAQSKKLFPFPITPLKNYCLSIYKNQANDGELLLIPAGRRTGKSFTDYAEKIQSFDWGDFYTNWYGEEFFEWFRQESEAIADVVLIDSRTGVTEMGGICTHQLADVVVMFVASNQQNLEGTLKIAQSLSNPDLIDKGREGRKLHILAIPSRIENNEADSLDDFAKQFKGSLEKFVPLILREGIQDSLFNELKIPYIPYYAYQERVAVREVVRESAADLIEAFEKLTTTLAKLAPADNRFHSFFLDSSVAFDVDQVKRILLLAANPIDKSQIQFDEEVREVIDGLHRSDHRDKFDLRFKFASRPRDVQRAMLQEEPNIVHFSGHGEGEDGLVLEGSDGRSQLVSDLALSNLFSLFSESVKVVILNGCYSAVQAKAIAEHIPYVIGMSLSISDRAALEFAISFYDALGAGESIEFAYQLGCNTLRLENILEEHVPVLLQKGKIPKTSKLSSARIFIS